MNGPADQPPRSAPPAGGANTPFSVNAPTVVTALIAVLAIIYLGFVLAPPALESRLEFWLTLWPQRMLMGAGAPGGLVGAVAPLFTHMFVHTDLLHLVMNAVWLLAFGAPVARRMGADVPGADQGQANFRFIAFFALSGFAGALLFSAAHPAEFTFARGASGGVSGLLGAIVRFALRPAPARFDNPWGLAKLFDRQVLIASFIIIVSNVAFGFIGLGGSSPAIAWEAHIGGYLFGLAAFPLFALRHRG